jgi:hypothetical protein
MLGRTSSILSSARCRHFLFKELCMTLFRGSTSFTSDFGGFPVKAVVYASIMASSMRAVVTPGRSALRAAIASETARRIRS